MEEGDLVELFWDGCYVASQQIIKADIGQPVLLRVPHSFIQNGTARLYYRVMHIGSSPALSAQLKIFVKLDCPGGEAIGEENQGLAPLVHKLPGGLLHVNTLASAFFAAVSGSVAATTVTVGKITLPELRQRGYDDEITIGSLACCGTLGILIPPSMPMLIYGFISGTSVGKLFIAGVLPGLILAILFSGYVIVRCLVKPSLAPNRGETYTAKERLAGVPQLLPVVLLILLVLGSIYTGYATPTEAASIGVIGSFLFAMINRKVNWQMLKESLLSTVNTTAMIMLIVMAAAYFSVAIGYIGIPRYLAALVSAIPFTAVYAVSNVVFLMLFARPIGKILERIKTKYAL